MSDADIGNAVVPGRRMEFETAEISEARHSEADAHSHKAPRPVTVEDVSDDDDDDEGNDSSVAMSSFQVDSSPSGLATPPASLSSGGTPRTTGATVCSSGSEDEKPIEQHIPEPTYVSPRPQRRLGPHPPPMPREHPHHHHPHQQNLHPLVTQPEVFRYLDSEPPNMVPEPVPVRRPRRGQGPPGAMPSDQAQSPAALRSPSIAPAHSAFPNDRLALVQSRPPPLEANTWGPPEYWSEGGQPAPFQKLASPTFPPGSGRPNGANGFQHGVPFGGPGGGGGGGPKHFPPPSYAPPRPHPRQRHQQSPSEYDQIHSPPPPPFSVPVHGFEPGDLTGYKYLTEKLSGSLFGPPITPIYRRFEVMGHRILLQLQDELCQLEDELEGIDNFETSSRFVNGSLMPASTRAAALDDHPVAQQRLEVLSKMSEKLDMYYQFLKLFKDAQCLSRPGMNEVEAYRQFLHNGVHIVDEETRFLGKTEDLLALPPTEPSYMDLRASGRHHRDRESETSTPTPGGTSRPISLKAASHRAEHADRFGLRGSEEHRPLDPSQLPMYFAYGVLVAVLVPVMTFPVFSGFAERLVIIALVFSGVGWTLWQAGVSYTRRPMDVVVCAGAYMMMMAMAAQICH